MNDDVFLVLTFPDGVTRSVADKPIEDLRATAREWQRLQPGTVAELRRVNTIVDERGRSMTTSSTLVLTLEPD